MALLALLLQNRRDVLRERRLVVGLGLVGRRGTGRGHERAERHPDTEPPAVRLRMHGLLLTPARAPRGKLT